MARTDRLVEDLQPNERPWSLWEQGYRMVDAEIEFVDRNGTLGQRMLLWQTLDIAPDYPVLQAFVTSLLQGPAAEIIAVRVTVREDLTADVLNANGLSTATH